MTLVIVAVIFCYLCAESVRRGAYAPDSEIRERYSQGGGGDCGFILISLLVGAVLFLMLAGGAAGGFHR